jgi:hypothetical protein
VEETLHERLERWTSRASAIEPALYALWAAIWTLSSAQTFYGYMLKQTRGEWSAPLDDVFIHFDYARATAEGHPFEWVAGNGYSSGNTSLSYPFVLAIGYLAGFHGQRLMLWAALVAATCTFATSLAARSLCVPERGPTSATDRLSAYLLPPIFLGVGALDWSLWSGMEIAFFLATWSAALMAYLSLVRARRGDVARRAWLLGLFGLVMVLTRPEAVTTVGVFAIGAAIALRKRAAGFSSGIVLRVGTPGALGVALQAATNRIVTGEWSASGAIVKLAIYNPFMSPGDKLKDYLFNLKYEFLRNVEYHFSDAAPFGYILPALALASVVVRRTRRVGLLLLAQVAGWALLVALNGQVRWQNERYTMPAVAWLLIAAALGASAMMRKEGRLWPVRLAGAIALVTLFYVHQAPNMRGQKWFFGRACRNIFDQHVTAGRFLDRIGARRVLVGDAGALIYASGRRGLDIIGLGGYRSLPFARAGLMGLPATIEIMEHVPAADRPDVLAIYPSWWGILPTWFGGTELARFPAEGNVICGGYEDVIYRSDWHLLGTGEEARLAPRESVRDSVDIADLLSEGDHDYRFDAPLSGYTEMKILPDPADTSRDMLDGGRVVRPGSEERMRLGALDARREARLIIRSAPTSHADIIVRVGGRDVETLHWTPTEGWEEQSVAVPGDRVTREIRVELYNRGPEAFVDYHVWVAQ